MDNEFVKALMDDNARLRKELDERVSAGISAHGVADNEKRELMWVIYNMLEKLGGKFNAP